MGRWTKRFWDRVNAYEKDETGEGITHSTSYHKYFQGYSERKVPRESGRGYRIERIYTADYYKYQEQDALWRLKKIYYFLLLAAATAAMIIGGISPSGLNSTKLIGVAQVLAWIPVSYLGYAMLSQLQAPRLMTIGEYRSASANLKTGALIAGIYLGAVAVLMATQKFRIGSWFDTNDGVALLGQFVAAGLIFLVFWMEREREIERVKNPNEVPYDANEIW